MSDEDYWIHEAERSESLQEGEDDYFSVWWLTGPSKIFKDLLICAGIGSFVGYALAAAIFFGIMKMM